jgi:RNA polymerase sigma-70 factor (ECF subfamily)
MAQFSTVPVMPPEQHPVASRSPRLPRLEESPRSEAQLVAAVLRKDRKATAEFVSQYADTVYGYVRHRLAPRADLVEDVVQDVFLAALSGLAGFRGTSPLRSWLLGIARHKVEDYYRAQLREPESLDERDDAVPAADGPLVEEAIDRERMEARTQHVLRQLPEAYGVALLWRYWESRSVHEIAEATGKTEKSVERLLARARARFKELWEQP